MEKRKTYEELTTLEFCKAFVYETTKETSKLKFTEFFNKRLKEKNIQVGDAIEEYCTIRFNGNFAQKDGLFFEISTYELIVDSVTNDNAYGGYGKHIKDDIIYANDLKLKLMDNKYFKEKIELSFYELSNCGDIYYSEDEGDIEISFEKNKDKFDFRFNSIKNEFIIYLENKYGSVEITDLNDLAIIEKERYPYVELGELIEKGNQIQRIENGYIFNNKYYSDLDELLESTKKIKNN